jgi:hypothetical protein
MTHKTKFALLAALVAALLLAGTAVGGSLMGMRVGNAGSHVQVVMVYCGIVASKDQEVNR